MILLELFLTFIKIGALCFGGGYASIAIVEKEIVNVKGWLTYNEFLDLLAIDEITPGPIILNIATFIGTKVGGFFGAVIATFGSIFIPCLISLLLIYLYRKYHEIKILNDILFVLKSMALALIISTFISIFINAIFLDNNISIMTLDYYLIIMAIISFILIRKYKIYPLIVMLGCGLMNLLLRNFIIY